MKANANVNLQRYLCRNLKSFVTIQLQVTVFAATLQINY